MIILSVLYDLETRSIDLTLAFPQTEVDVDVDVDVLIEFPVGFDL